MSHRHLHILVLHPPLIRRVDAHDVARQPDDALANLCTRDARRVENDDFATLEGLAETNGEGVFDNGFGGDTECWEHGGAVDLHLAREFR